jgi:flagellar export protein FliJ
VKPFRFRLARILEHRRTEEADALQRMADATGRLADAEAALRDAETSLRAAQATDARTLERRRQLEVWLDRLGDEVAACRIVRGVAEGDLEAARAEWLGCRMRRRALEILEARDYEAWKTDAARRAQNELDEWAGTRRRA